MIDRDRNIQEAFVGELVKITHLTHDEALTAYFSVKNNTIMTPEKQARIYASLYGLSRVGGRK